MTLKTADVLDYIAHKKIASTEDIAGAFSTSDSTVRRALTKLDMEKKIVRFHGGAALYGSAESRSDLYTQRGKNGKVKDAIAQKAASIIKDREKIILLGGTTVAGMCKYLLHKQITVITNSILVLDELKNANDIRLIILGGEYSPAEEEVGGTFTLNNIKMLNADYLFTSCTAFDLQRGFSTEHFQAINFYEQCYSCAKRVVVLADSSKYNKTVLAVIAEHNNVDCLISDGGLSEETVKAFEKMEIKVLIV